ncbi:iron-containing alcohol dehydrogenase, partial [bacterium]|nr:iron-containing alcohol dehydrogenase [bacterium]
MWAGSLSHNDLTGCGRDLFFPVHQMEHEVSGMYPEVAHGAGLAALYPAWMKYVYAKDLARYVRFAVEVFGCAMNWEHPERTAQEGIAHLEAYFQAIGMPVTLKELGADDESKFAEMADKCLFFGKRRMTAKVELLKEDIIKIFRMARGA